MNQSPSPTPLVRCGGCGEPPVGGVLRRGRCPRCYESWVRARPIGLGASCASCENHRRVHLRYYEVGFRSNAVGGRWIILCHNCAASADALDPPPRSIDGLKMRLVRDRRWGDRRAEAVGRPSLRAEWLERRRGDRRAPPPGLADETLLDDELVIEMEAEFEEVGDDQIEEQDEVTGIHHKLAAAVVDEELASAVEQAVADAIAAATDGSDDEDDSLTADPAAFLADKPSH